MAGFTTILRKYDQQGEKTGWTYIEIPADVTEELKPGYRKSFRVKGKLDNFRISGIALIPVGGGKFIMAVNAGLRKKIGKRYGALINVQLEIDNKAFEFNKDFIACLNDDPGAKSFFETLPGSHQRYFSKWIDSAKTEPTRIKRITLAVNALARKWGYSEMIRASSGNRQ
jgi:hypothetical protein